VVLRKLTSFVSKAALAPRNPLAVSGGVDDVSLGPAHLGFQFRNTLLVLAAELEVDPAHVSVSRQFGRSDFLDRPASKIAGVSFHARHPDGRPKRFAPRESLQPKLSH